MHLVHLWQRTFQGQQWRDTALSSRDTPVSVVPREDVRTPLDEEDESNNLSRVEDRVGEATVAVKITPRNKMMMINFLIILFR